MAVSPSMSAFRSSLMRASSGSTKYLGMLWGESFPFYYVVEYPRSGGTWLGDMIGDYLQIPFPKESVFPPGCRAVIHSHWGYSSRLRRVFYMYRDGRDVVVSLYFYVLRDLDNADRARRRYLADRFPYLLDPRLDRLDAAAIMPRFIEDWVKRPYGCRMSWVEHVSQWAFDRPHVVNVRYGDLLDRPDAVLSAIIERHTGEEADPERVAATVAKFSFERQTHRRRGTEDRDNPKRKGIVGDWRNHFSREAGEVFDHYAGELLIRLGYEPDSSWVARLER